MKNFALIGVAGYIAPKHLKAIRDTDNMLVAALDPHDSVGILDQYFPECSFFTEFERFDRHLEKLRRLGENNRVHYVSICSPNYLHDAHIRAALRIGAHAICEKPLVLNPWNLDPLCELEQETGKRVYNILQLRVHPALIALKERVTAEARSQAEPRKHTVVLTYITSRGGWYHYSWKGQLDRSGGLATNIGIHFFDLLMWLFGDVVRNEVHHADQKKTSGVLELRHASVQWYLSVDANDLPVNCGATDQRTYRSIELDGAAVEFSEGFADLHTVLYREILAGGGFGIDVARPAIALAHDIRCSTPIGQQPNSHPLLRTQRNA